MWTNVVNYNVKDLNLIVKCFHEIKAILWAQISIEITYHAEILKMILFTHLQSVI